MDSKSRHRLFSKLDKRFPILLADLDFLLASPSLATWRDAQKNLFMSDLYKLQEKLQKFTIEFKPVFLERIMCKKNKKGENMFWIKTYKLGYSDRVYDPNNLTKGLKRRHFPEALVRDMVEAHRHHLIPKDELNPKLRDEIMKELEKLRLRQNPIPATRTVNSKEEEAKAEIRRQYRHSIRELTRQCNESLSSAKIPWTIEQLLYEEQERQKAKKGN